LQIAIPDKHRGKSNPAKVSQSSESGAVIHPVSARRSPLFAVDPEVAKQAKREAIQGLISREKREKADRKSGG
jgi:hypothetical protein